MSVDRFQHHPFICAQGRCSSPLSLSPNAKTATSREELWCGWNFAEDPTLYMYTRAPVHVGVRVADETRSREDLPLSCVAGIRSTSESNVGE